MAMTIPTNGLPLKTRVGKLTQTGVFVNSWWVPAVQGLNPFQVTKQRLKYATTQPSAYVNSTSIPPIKIGKSTQSADRHSPILVLENLGVPRVRTPHQPTHRRLRQRPRVLLLV